MSTSTCQEVREVMLDDFGLGRRGTNTGTSASSVTDDANFGGPGAAEGIEVGCQMMITSGARDGDIVQLSSRPKQATGVISVDPAFGAALANTDTFEILYGRLRFEGNQGVRDKINEALASFPWERQLMPITLVADGDMLSTGVTDWTVGATATRTKVAASFPHALRVLEVTAAADDDYVRTASIGVEEKKSYFLEVTGVISGSGAAADEGTLILYDVTNGANISLDETTIDRFEPGILMNSVETPSSCEQVQVWLRSENSGDIIDWANLILRKNEAREFTIQDRPVHILRLGKLLATRVDTWGRRGRDWTEVSAEPVPVGEGIWQYQTSEDLSGYSVWYEEFIRPGSLDSDSDTTSIPKEHLAAVAAEMVLRPLRTDKRWAAKWDYAARAAAVVRQAYSSLHTVRNEGQRVYVLPAV